MAIVSAVLGWRGRRARAGAAAHDDRDATRRSPRTTSTSASRCKGPQDELKELADTIDGLLARLEAAFDAQRQFVANASHELRTPLAIMRATLDVAVAKPEGVPAADPSAGCEPARRTSTRPTGCWRASSCSPAPSTATGRRPRARLARRDGDRSARRPPRTDRGKPDRGPYGPRVRPRRRAARRCWRGWSKT